jgi:hypothetical protein
MINAAASPPSLVEAGQPPADLLAIACETGDAHKKMREPDEDRQI